jgi:protein-tyrosine phosphatase
MEIYEIAPGLFQSSAYKVDDFKILKNLGIEVVIDLAGGFDPQYQGLKAYVYWPISDIPELPDCPQLWNIAAFGCSFWKRSELKVLVHCTQGVNRSSLVNGYILYLSGMNGTDIVKLIRDKRPGALTNQVFYEYLNNLPLWAKEIE